MKDIEKDRLQRLLHFFEQMSEKQRCQTMQTVGEIFTLDTEYYLDDYSFAFGDKHRVCYLPQSNRFLVFNSNNNNVAYIVDTDEVDDLHEESVVDITTEQIKAIMDGIKEPSERITVFLILTALSSIAEKNRDFETAMSLLESPTEKKRENFTMIDKTGRRYYYDPYLNDFAGEVRKWVQK